MLDNQSSTANNNNKKSQPFMFHRKHKSDLESINGYAYQISKCIGKKNMFPKITTKNTPQIL